MPNMMRWRYGDTQPVIAAVDSGLQIEIGDLLWLDGDRAKPASALADQGTKVANQRLFADRFLGVAMQQSRAGDSRPIRVATTGVFEFDCTSGIFELGEWVGVEENAAGDALLDQCLVKVTDPSLAIGRVARRSGGQARRVLVDLRSTIMTGGIEGTTASSS